MKRFVLLATLISLSGCNDNKSTVPDLPAQPDKWVEKVVLQDDSAVRHVGVTSAVLKATTVSPIKGLKSIAVGDDIDGVHVEAIKCSFFAKDYTYENQQFMWRGRWGCMAGRSKSEVMNANKGDDTVYDYIHTSPVSLDGPK